MKTLDILLKDIRRYFRSFFALGMMFLAPLLITALLYFAFGRSKEGGQFNLAPTRLQIANLDRPEEQEGLAAGNLLVEQLQGPAMQDLLQVTLAPDEASARAAVDRRAADVALVIPENFSAAAVQPEATAALRLYHDPALTLGPEIVKILVGEYLDSFTGTKIAIEVTLAGLQSNGLAHDPQMIRMVEQKYVAWTQAQRDNGSGPDGNRALVVRVPSADNQVSNPQTSMLGPVMAGMMIMFVFFTGASSASSLLMENEEGTLARLCTTPTSLASILGGKMIAVLLILAVQVAVLMGAARVLFSIHWGHPVSVGLMAASLVVAAAGFGILLMSFLRSMRQAGPVMGGVVTLTAMLGGLFTAGIPNLPASFARFSLVVPQGWAMNGWRLALSGADVTGVLLYAGVLFGLGISFFAAGVLVMRRRFA